MTRINFWAYVVTTNGFVLSHDKSLQIYLICVNRQAKNDFLTDIENTVSSFLDQFVLIFSFTVGHFVSQ